MKQIYANNCTTPLLGRQGENLASKVAFGLSDWASDYVDGTATPISANVPEKPQAAQSCFSTCHMNW